MVARAIKDKGVKLDLEKLMQLDIQRRQQVQELDHFNHQRKELAALIKKSGKPDAQVIKRGKDIKDKIAKADKKRKLTEEEYQQLMLLVPNVYSADTPVGKDENDNKEANIASKENETRITNCTNCGNPMKLVGMITKYGEWINAPPKIINGTQKIISINKAA